MEGEIEIVDSNTLLQYTIYYASGTTISSFPTNNSYLYFADLKDQSNIWRAADIFLNRFLSLSLSGMEVVTGTSSHHRSVPVLGLYQTGKTGNTGSSSGRIIVYGDSNCVDSAHLQFGMSENIAAGI